MCSAAIRTRTGPRQGGDGRAVLHVDDLAVDFGERPVVVEQILRDIVIADRVRHAVPGRQRTRRILGDPSGNTTPTDPRSWRNRVGRRAGQISDRTRGPYSRRPARDWCPRSRPCPGGCSLPALATEPAHGFHTRYQGDDRHCILREHRPRRTRGSNSVPVLVPAETEPSLPTHPAQVLSLRAARGGRDVRGLEACPSSAIGARVWVAREPSRPATMAARICLTGSAAREVKRLPAGPGGAWASP